MGVVTPSGNFFSQVVVAVAHTFIPSSWKAEAGGYQFEASLSTQQVRGHPELHRETMLQKNKTKQNNFINMRVGMHAWYARGNQRITCGSWLSSVVGSGNQTQACMANTFIQGIISLAQFFFF